MRIVVNDIAASSGGALSILRDFHKYITENDKENEWIFLLNSRYIEETENIKVIILDYVKSNWFNKLKFDFFDGKRFICNLNPDVVFSLQNIVTFGLKTKQIIYIHQAIPFQKIKKFSFLKSDERVFAIYQYIIGWIIKRSIKKCDKVIVQTEWMKKAIIDSTKVSQDKIINILPSIPEITGYGTGIICKTNLFFYPSGSGLYKNFKCIYDSCNLLISRGCRDFEIQLTVLQNEYHVINDNIKYLGTITREQVINKYCTSTLIFPSYIETVGLPLIEARQLGTIILSSDCPFAREVLDGYENAYFFNPFKPDELVDLMQKVITGQITKKPISKKELDTKNSWSNVTDIVLGIV